VKTISPTRSPSFETSITQELPDEKISSQSRDDDISVIIGASLGGALCLLCCAYIVKMVHQYCRKDTVKQKKMEDYCKRLALINGREGETTVANLFSAEADKPVGGPAGKARSKRNHQGNKEQQMPKLELAIVPDVAPEMPCVDKNNQPSSDASVNRENDSSRPSISLSSRENALEEGRAANDDADRSDSAESDVGVVSAISSVENSLASSGWSDVHSGTGSDMGESEEDVWHASDSKSDTEQDVGCSDGSSSDGQKSASGSDRSGAASIDTMNEHTGFPDFRAVMSDESNGSEDFTYDGDSDKHRASAE